MLLELLHQISKQTLTFTITDKEEIDKLRGFESCRVAAFLPFIHTKKPFAHSLAIIKQDRDALRCRNDTGS